MKTMNRYRASLVHLGLSLAAGILVFLAVRYLWYRGPLFELAGGRELFILIVSVDVALGPLITLIVFVPGKKGLRFDLTTIAVLQLAALVYGLWALSGSRPVFIAFVKDRFELVRAIDLEAEDLAAGSRPEFRTRSWAGPRFVGVRLPTDPQEQSRLMDLATLGGRDAHVFPKYYVPYDEVAGEVVARSQPLEKLRAFNPGRGAEVDRLVAGGEGLRFLPLKTGKGDLAVLVERARGHVVGLSSLRPWPY